MSYLNPHSVGGEVQRVLDSGEYSINSHGDIGAHYNSITNSDLPPYTTMFYRPSEHEVFSDVKYDKLSLDYDNGMREMRDGVRGPPMEAYIPMPVLVPDGVGANSDVIIREPDIMPAKKVVEEILRAQAEVIGKDNKKVIAIRTTEVEQELHIRRRMKKVEIFRR